MKKPKRMSAGKGLFGLILAVAGIISSNWLLQQTIPSGSSSSSSASVSANFNISTAACGGAANCLQWVDDDSTDNCGAATTNFWSQVNSYTGPGAPQVNIWGSGTASSKAFKLTTCNIPLLIPTALHLQATLDCAQTAANCIQVCPSNLSVQGSLTQKYLIDGGGTLVGGVNLTNGGIEIEPHCTDAHVNDIQFFNFGAGNATIGNCTNFALIVDSPVFEATVAKTQWYFNDAISGRCAFSNATGGGSGTNTVLFIDNVMGGTFGAVACQSTGIIEGGAFAEIRGNNITGFGIGIRAQGSGTRIISNAMDAQGCTNHGSSAVVQYSGTPTRNLALIGNVVNANQLLGKAGDTAGATLARVTIVGTVAYNDNGGGVDSSSCIVSTQGAPCFISNSTSMAPLAQSGATNNGWIMDGLVGTLSQTNLSANLGSTLLINVPLTTTYQILCQASETTAAGTSSTLPSILVAYTDVFTGVAQTVTLTPTNAANTVGTIQQGSALIALSNATPAVNISTTGYLSNAAAAMKYRVDCRLMWTH